MKNSNSLSTFVRLLFSGVWIFHIFGCESIVGIEERSLYVDPSQGGVGGLSNEGGSAGTHAGTAGTGGDELGGAGQGGEAQGGAGQGGAGQGGDNQGGAGQGGVGGATVCDLGPMTGTGLRFGNFVPSLARYDICIKPKASADYAGVTPVLRGGACPGGLDYKQVSAPLTLSSGLYDVKWIPEAAQDCNEPGVGTVEGVSIKTGTVVDLFLMGDSADFAPYKFNESGPAAQYNTAFRFLHSAKGVAPIDVVLADAASPPATYNQYLFQNLAYNTLPNSSPFEKVDANGYLQIAIFGSTLNIGIDDVGGTAARKVRSTLFASDAVLSMFLVGTPSDPRFPQELLLCDSLQNDPAAPYLAMCNGGQAFQQPVRFSTFNASLTGVFAPNEPERRPEIIKALASADTDVLCIGELWAQADKDAIIAATKAKFPHHYSFESNEKTPLYEVKKQDGSEPVPYDSPPCSSDTDLTKLNTLIDCIKAKCSSDPTSEEATTIPGSCASSAQGCQSAFASMVFQNKDCYTCALDQIQSFQTMAYTRDACTKHNDRRFAYQGDNPNLILSKSPIVESEAFMLPASEWRVSVLRSTVKLSNDALVDVYCTTLTTPVDSITRPYVGNYGDGNSGIAAWNAENKYQAQLLAKLVQEKSKYRRAVVLGELYSGPDAKDGAKVILDPYTPESWQVLQSNFGVGTEPGYKPACTYCSTNPLVGGKLNYWASHLLTQNLSVSNVSSTKILFTEAFIPANVGDPPTLTKIPLSRHYSLSSVVSFDP